MSLAFSPHVTIQVRDYENAVMFYQNAFGMQLERLAGSEAELSLGPMTFHLEDAPDGQVFFAFRTDDLEGDRENLVRLGCRVTRIHGDGSVTLEDPYGMRFHLSR